MALMVHDVIYGVYPHVIKASISGKGRISIVAAVVKFISHTRDLDKTTCVRDSTTRVDGV